MAASVARQAIAGNKRACVVPGEGRNMWWNKKASQLMRGALACGPENQKGRDANVRNVPPVADVSDRPAVPSRHRRGPRLRFCDRQGTADDHRRRSRPSSSRSAPTAITRVRFRMSSSRSPRTRCRTWRASGLPSCACSTAPAVSRRAHQHARLGHRVYHQGRNSFAAGRRTGRDVRASGSPSSSRPARRIWSPPMPA